MLRSRKPLQRRDMRSIIKKLAELTRWLAIPLAVLLFLQWPLRDLLHAYSRDANDAAQWIFALYVSVAVSAASSTRTHLCAHALIPIHNRIYIAMRKYLASLCMLLWGGYVLWTFVPTAWRSLMQLEHFSETLNPGYFLIKLAAGLLAALVVTQALLDLSSPTPTTPST